MFWEVRAMLAVKRVPTWTGKPGKMGRHFPVRESQGFRTRLEKSGKIHKILENWGNFSVTVEWMCVLFAKFDEVFSSKRITEKDWKMGKNTRKVREFCQSGKVGTMVKSVMKSMICMLYLAKLVWYMYRHALEMSFVHDDNLLEEVSALSFISWSNNNNNLFTLNLQMSLLPLIRFVTYLSICIIWKFNLFNLSDLVKCLLYWIKYFLASWYKIWFDSFLKIKQDGLYFPMSWQHLSTIQWHANLTYFFSSAVKWYLIKKTE